jgi:hypothetical protein
LGEPFKRRSAHVPFIICGEPPDRISSRDAGSQTGMVDKLSGKAKGLGFSFFGRVLLAPRYREPYRDGGL